MEMGGSATETETEFAGEEEELTVRESLCCRSPPLEEDMTLLQLLLVSSSDGVAGGDKILISMFVLIQLTDCPRYSFVAL